MNNKEGYGVLWTALSGIMPEPPTKSVVLSHMELLLKDEIYARLTRKWSLLPEENGDTWADLLSYSKEVWNSSHCCSKKATLIADNVLPLRSTPEGAEVCNVEDHVSDRGVFARASGEWAIVASHDPDNGTSRIKLPYHLFL